MTNRLIQSGAIDHFTGQAIVYPASVADTPMKFDFLFRKFGGEWRYIASFDTPSAQLEKQKDVVVNGGGGRRIVAPRFGYIVQASHSITEDQAV